MCIRDRFEPYQVYQARAWGADCILVIMATVSNEEAVALERTARDLGMYTLVEVHDEDELERALTHLTTPLLGFNNRDLKTFKTSLSISERLAKLVPDNKILVSESGLASKQDLARMAKANIRAFLIGEGLMRHQDVAAATK